ncbi:MAG: hypothetical protein ACKPHU_10175, partial [Planctomycetaceae bacterium]
LPQPGPPTPASTRAPALRFTGSKPVSRPVTSPAQPAVSPAAADLFFGSSLLTDSLLQGLLTGGTIQHQANSSRKV